MRELTVESGGIDRMSVVVLCELRVVVRIFAEGEAVSELQVVGTAPSDWSDKSDPSYTPARKYIENGILYIDRNGITYTAQGQRLD